MNNFIRRILVFALSVHITLLCGAAVFAAPGPQEEEEGAQASPFKFEIKTVNAATGAAKNDFYVGETVAIVFTVTNQSSVTRTITQLEQTEIPVKLTGTPNMEDTTFVYEGVRGGTLSVEQDSGGSTHWMAFPASTMQLAPGQSVSVNIDDLSRFFAQKLDDGSYSFSATYNGNLQSQASFTVVADQRSVPVLQQLAASPDEMDQRWANSHLDIMNKPSASGRITDASGQGVGGVTIRVTGTNATRFESRADGKYDIILLTSGGNYTLTPQLKGYTFAPASRTVSNLTTKQVNLNFTATRDAAPRVNVASMDRGAVATASTASPAYPAKSAIDGSRSGVGWGHGSGGWSDATENVFPDWIEVNFGGTKAVNEINVYTVQDAYTNPVEPTLTQTFTLYGITNFDVQYWNGTAWVAVPGGTVNGNNKVWRQFTFAAINTSKIRVNVRGALYGLSRITEIEAFQVNVPPTISILGTYTGAPGDIINFNSSAVDSDGRIMSYQWNFGDNTTGTGATPAHVYTTAGTYTVTLRVTDDSGETSTATKTVKITSPPQAPEAFAGGPYEGYVSFGVPFDGRASSDPDGTISAYQWNFGDNTTGTGIAPTHTYSQPGTYNVTLTVTDNSGMTDTATAVATITAPPPPAPSGLLATTNTGSQVLLTWTVASQPHHFQIERSQTLNGTYTALAASPTANSFTDNSVSPGGVYFYRVYAVNASGERSEASNTDIAATFTFTDPVLTAGSTPIKALHFTELRQAINAIRSAVGLQPATWTDTTLSNQLIRAVHMQELRTNLDQALALIDPSAAIYTDNPVVIGITVKKAHLEELRQRLK
jgi:PKD repeat protein